MNNKGQTKLIVGIVLGVLFIGGIIFLVSVLNQGETNQSAVSPDFINLYVIARDSLSSTSINGNYTVQNGSTYISGEILRDSFTEINNLTSNGTFSLLCQSEGYYSKIDARKFNSQELNDNLSKRDCYLDRIGKIEVGSNDKLEEGENDVSVTILAKGFYKNITFCVSWTEGIVTLKSDLKEDEIPKRYYQQVDKCYSINKDLKDESIELDFEIKTEIMSKIDKVTFYFFDKDYSYTEEFEQVSEYQNQNLGDKEDVILEITAVQ